MTYTTITILYNPNSTGSSKDLAREFEKQLRDKMPKQKIKCIATEYAGHAEELTYSIAQSSKNPLIISSSGDGGYNEVVNGAMKAQKEGFMITTSLLPAGNANDHYHNLHEADIIDSIIKNKTKKIDLLKIASTSEGNLIERYAHSYIGFGLTPYVGKELNKTKLNFFKEIWLVVRAFFKVKAVRLEIDKKVHYYESVIFSNVDKMSKYLQVSQSSSTTDGKCEVTISRRRSKLNLIFILLKATSFTGLKEDRQVSKFVLKTIDKTLVQADGEIITIDADAAVTISVEKRSLTCII